MYVCIYIIYIYIYVRQIPWQEHKCIYRCLWCLCSGEATQQHPGSSQPFHSGCTASPQSLQSSHLVRRRVRMTRRWCQICNACPKGSKLHRGPNAADSHVLCLPSRNVWMCSTCGSPHKWSELHPLGCKLLHCRRQPQPRTSCCLQSDDWST